MASVKKKQIKPLVSIFPLEPKDIERFWPLAEFMVAEALAFSGKYAMSRSSGQGLYMENYNRTTGVFGPKPYQRPYFYPVPKVRGGC